jgi:hypothetical protein
MIIYKEKTLKILTSLMQLHNKIKFTLKKGEIIKILDCGQSPVKSFTM